MSAVSEKLLSTFKTDEVLDWAEHPITLAFAAVLDEQKETLMDGWMEGRYQTDAAEKTARGGAVTFEWTALSIKELPELIADRKTGVSA